MNSAEAVLKEALCRERGGIIAGPDPPLTEQLLPEYASRSVNWTLVGHCQTGRLAPPLCSPYSLGMSTVLPPTSSALRDPDARPYFLWWTDATVEVFRRHLLDPDPKRRAYWMGALMREANTRDVWLFVAPDDIREAWPHLLRHLGRSQAMWAYLLQIGGDEASDHRRPGGD